MLMLREILTAQNKSIATLVRDSGLSRRTIEDVLKRGDCRISTARIIADTLGCSLDELYTTEEAGE